MLLLIPRSSYQPPELSLPQGVQPVALDNTLKFSVDDSAALPGAKSAAPPVPPRDDEAVIIEEEHLSAEEVQRMYMFSLCILVSLFLFFSNFFFSSPRSNKPSAAYEDARAAFSRTFTARPEKLKHFKVHPAMELFKAEETYGACCLFILI